MTARHFAVRLTGSRSTWGPFTDKGLAEQFADYVTHEIDPAEVIPMQDPVRDLLAWRRGVALPRIDHLEGALAVYDVQDRQADNQIKPGHLPRCARKDPHFYPSQCSPRQDVAEAAEAIRAAGGG